LDASPQLLRKINYRTRIRRVIKYASSIIIVSPHMIDTLKLDRYKKKVHLVPCSVDPAEFTTERAAADDHKPVRILHSGRLTSKKGVPDLISVCIELNKIYPDIEVDIVGEGNDLKLCRELIAESDATNIHLHGVQPQSEVRRFMSEADIFALNSRVGDSGDMEGTPVSIQEAMSMKLAVVSTYHAGIPLLITNEENGLLVEERDNEALKSALIRLINDPAMRTRLGTAARKTIEEKFTVESMNRKIFEVYKDSLK
ncbi:MAG: glycosyltransferase, partial [Chitinophagaceae bacterium]|nr:glycosyltransferase [Chitinophagaceae bacterium]